MHYPTLTIADVTNPVAESAGSVDFVVTARDAGSFTFRYQASEVDGANFLNENQTPTSQEAIMETTLIFGQVGGTGDNVATLSVDIHDDEEGENTGRILVTLLGPASGQTPTYQVNTDGTENAYATIWDDDAPVVSIGNATNVTESSTAELSFPLTALVAISSSIDVYYTLAENPASGDSGFIAGSETGSGLFKSVNFNNTTSGNLVIPIEDDEVVEGDSTVTVTLEAQSGVTLATAKYNIATPNDPATATVSDDDVSKTQIVTITSAAAGDSGTGVTEGLSFDFTVTSNKAITSSALEVQLTPSYTGGSTDPNATIQGTTVSIPVGERMATGTVTMDSDFDIEATDDVKIVITLVDAADYNLSSDTTKQSISVAVKDNDLPSVTSPNMSISAVDYIADGGTITFTITASPAPTNVTNVNVMLGGESFIEDGRLLQEIVPVGGSNPGTFEVITKSGSVTSGHGLITATLLDGEDYTRSSTGYTTSVAVLDELPVISVSAPAAVDETDDATSSFDVTLTIVTADFIPLAGKPLVIDGLTIANVSDPLFQNYYQSHITDIQFTDANDSTDRDITVPVTISGDADDYMGWGEISIALASGDEYTADPNNNSATVTVREDEPAPVSVAIRVANSVIGGENIDVTLVATNSATDDIEIEVDFQATNVAGSYLDYTNTKVMITAAANGDTNKQVLIPTTVVPEGSQGMIGLVVLSGNGYDPTSTDVVNVTVMPPIQDPVLTVSAGPAVDEGSGDKATFTISSDEDLGTGFKFRYQLTQRGNVLASGPTIGSSVLAEKDFTESGGKYITTFEFDIEDDTDTKEETGLVTLTLLAKDGTTGDYAIPDDPSATVKVYDNEVPALEIAGGASVTEGPNAKAQFNVTARFNVTGAILFRYQPDDGFGSFLTGTTAGTPQIGRLNFNGTDTASFTVPIYDDAVAEENGTVTAELLPENGGIFNYTVAPAPDNIGSVSVNDNDAIQSADIQMVTLHTEPIPTIGAIGIANVDYYVSVGTAVTKDLEVVYEYIYGLGETPISSGNGGGTAPGFNPNPVQDAPSQWTRGVVTIQAGDTTGQFTIPVQTFFGTNVTVRLVDGANYDLGNPSQQNLPTQTATAADPLVSIDVVGNRRILEIPDVVYLRDDNGNLIRDPQTGAIMIDTSHTKFKTKFVVSANPSPAGGSSIPVDVSFTTTNVSIVGENSNTFTRRVVLSNQQTTAEIEFELEVNDSAGGHGTITAVVPDGTGYQVGSYSNSAAVSIIDDESLPVLTINNPDPVSESAGSVTFNIRSNSQPAGDSLRVQYGLREPTGDFLVFQAPSYLPLEQRVLAASQLLNFTEVAGSSGTYEADLVIELDNDEVAEANGSVSVTLVSDTNFTYHVVTGTNDVGVVQITDDDTPAPTLPVISISSAAEANGVTEEYSFTFEVESDIDLGGTPLDISFTVTDGGTGATITGTTVTN